MVAKTQAPVSQFNLPKGAPFVPTKVPKLPKPTGQKRLETTQQPRQVGVQTPLERAAAVKQAAPAVLPTATTAAPTVPGVGTVATQLPYVPSAPAPEFAAIGYGGSGGDAPPPEEQTITEPPEDKYYEEANVTKEMLAPLLEEKGYTLGEQDNLGSYPILDADGNIAGYYYKHETGPWTVAWEESGGKVDKPPDAGKYSYQDSSGNWVDPTDTEAPGYNPATDPTSPEYNPYLKGYQTGVSLFETSGDEAVQQKVDAMDAEASIAASAAKRAAQARYGASGFEGSAQYMQEMGSIDQQIWAANQTAKADLHMEKYKADREEDIELLRQQMEFATGEEKAKLQTELTQMMLDRQKEDALLTQFWNAPQSLMDTFGADAFDETAFTDFQNDMAEAFATGDDAAVMKVMANVKYADSKLYYETEWVNPKDVWAKEQWADHHVTFADRGWNNYADIGEVREWMIQNGMDPQYAADMITAMNHLGQTVYKQGGAWGAFMKWLAE
jgi:hypothetical protein